MIYNEHLNVEDLINMTCASISVKEACTVLGCGYKQLLEQIKNGEVEFKCVKAGRVYRVMRIPLITYITGETFEEQIRHRENNIRRGIALDDYDKAILRKVRM
ncbi:MAG: hypothetical protein ACI4JJ_03915 [Huintestinicola sp.]